MNMLTYEPWTGVSKLHDEINRLFQNRYQRLDDADSSNVATSHWAPAVDIKEEPQRFVITADIPGVPPEAIEITMENGLLSIKGERREENSEDRNGYKRVERVSGTFYRRFSLPDSVDADGIKASGKYGVLEIIIPKVAKAKARRIEVNP